MNVTEMIVHQRRDEPLKHVNVLGRWFELDAEYANDSNWEEL